MDEKLDKIIEKINIIDEKQDHIINLLKNDIKPDCNKMGNHINFVETVYETVKHPLSYICKEINYFSGNNNKLNDKNNDNFNLK